MLKSFVGIIPKWRHATSKKEPKEKRKDNIGIGPKTLESLHTQINQKELVWDTLGCPKLVWVAPKNPPKFGLG